MMLLFHKYNFSSKHNKQESVSKPCINLASDAKKYSISFPAPTGVTVDVTLCLRSNGDAQ